MFRGRGECGLVRSIPVGKVPMVAKAFEVTESTVPDLNADGRAIDEEMTPVVKFVGLIITRVVCCSVR